MLTYLKKHIKVLAIAYDVLSIPIAWCMAYWLRDNMEFLSNTLTIEQSFNSIYILAIIQVISYHHFKVFRSLWRFASIDDLQRIIRAVITAVLAFILVTYLLQSMVPRSIFPLYAASLLAFLCGGRLAVRLIYDRKNNVIKSRNVKKVLVVGAGQAGEGLLRELKRSRDYLPICIVDDNLRKQGLDIHGVRVMGGLQDIAKLCRQMDVDLIFIAIASANSNLMRKLVNLCEDANVAFQTLPSLDTSDSCQVNLDSLRTVSIEDLLGRDQVQIEWDKISASIENKCVLVSGGGGSIGSELCRQIAKFNPKTLIIVDNNEYNLYSIDTEFSANLPNVKRIISLTSVIDKTGLESVFKKYRPQVVFHAAAYKHVPMLEDQVRIAAQNNILGTRTIAETSVKYLADKFILISTDKAVNPTNVMGSTKRVAEIYCQNLNQRATTQFITVRFGNVLGSRGSVVPLFQEQLKKGGPLTVTHPDMQRYFMTIPEATQLILQAMVNGSGSEIFVLNMGEPVKISYLAEQVIRLAGLQPHKDIEIKYTGLRPGEKLYEELFHSAEMLVKTEHQKLFQAQFREIKWNILLDSIEKIEYACQNNYDEEIISLIKTLVPEFKNCSHAKSTEISSEEVYS